MPSKRVLVIGATGVAGSAFINHILTNPGSYPDWELTGVTRQSRQDPPSVTENRLRYVQADLLSDYSTLKTLTDITHVVFAGFVPAPDFEQQVAPNRDIVINCLQALERCPIERFLLIQGMKYYGSHLGAFKTPAREDDARHAGANYYYAQQDALEQSGVSWTCLRPHVICGTTSVGTPQNILTVLGVYAALMRKLDQPLYWPGTATSFSTINQATDAGLLARAIGWFLQYEQAHQEAYNITNGDYFRWENLWPRLADHFSMADGGVRTTDLATTMPALATQWDEIVRDQDLQPYNMTAVAHWPFADYILRTGWDVMANTTKARLAGFHDCLDTETMYLEHFASLQRLRILPT